MEMALWITAWVYGPGDCVTYSRGSAMTLREAAVGARDGSILVQRATIHCAVSASCSSAMARGKSRLFSRWTCRCRSVSKALRP